jgi:hypothetical protein
MKIKRELLSSIRRQILARVMTRKGLENIVTTGKIDGKKDSRKQCEKIARQSDSIACNEVSK